MRAAAFLSALLGVAAGLLVGMLLWGGSPQSPALSADDKVQVEIRDALRDIRTLLDRQPAGARAALAELSSTAPAAAQPEPLTASASARSVEELRAALDEAVTALHRLAAEGGGGFADTVVSPDAAATLKAALEPDGKTKPLDLFGCSPRDVFARLGRPQSTWTRDGVVSWTYWPDAAKSQRQVHVTFIEGYVTETESTGNR